MANNRGNMGRQEERPGRMPMGAIVLVVSVFIIFGHVLAMSLPAMEIDLGTLVITEDENAALHQEEIVRKEKRNELEAARARQQDNEASIAHDDHAAITKRISADKIEREKSSIENDLLLLGHHKKRDDVQKEMDEAARKEHEAARMEQEEAAKIVSELRAATKPPRTKKPRAGPSTASPAKTATPKRKKTHKVTAPNPPAAAPKAGGLGTVLLLSSHERLVLYDVDRDRWSDVDGDHDKYYGLLPGTTPSTVLVSRIVAVGPTADAIIEVDLLREDGAGYVKSAEVQTRYMHDAVLSPDKAAVLVADVAGIVHVLSYPALLPVKTLPAFTKQEHINTIAPTDHGTAWIVLHNVGPSKVVELDLSTGFRLCTLENVGHQAHGFVRVDNGTRAIMLSSKEAALVRVEIPETCRGQVSDAAVTEVIWQYEGDGQDPKFLKGLIVVDRVAYFGMSDFKSSRTERTIVPTALVAVNIDTGEKLWERPGIGTRGIVNIIAAPYVAVDSTWRELSSSAFANAPLDLSSRVWRERGSENPEPSADLASLNPGSTSTQVQSPEVLEPSDASSLSVPADLEESSGSVAVPEVQKSVCVTETLRDVAEAKILGHGYGLTRTTDAFLKLPLKFDENLLAAELDLLYKKYDFTYRADVNNYFLLLVTQYGILEQGRIGPFTPVPERLSLVPYTRKVLDTIGAVVGRSRYMMLKAGEKVVRHTDDVKFVKKQRGRKNAQPQLQQTKPIYTNGYWGRRFRVHIPVVTHEKVKFGSGSSEIFMEPGYAYLFDNGNFHWVSNDSPIDRVHLIFDTVGSKSLFDLAKRATVYRKSGEIIPGDAPVEIMPDPEADAKIQPLTERWAGANAMSPMSSQAIAEFVNGEIIARISDEVARAKVEAAFREFSQAWAASCTESQTVVPAACESAARTLLERVGEEVECSERVVLEGSSMSVFDAMEVILRQAFLVCGPKLLDSSTLDLSRAQTAPILPVEGHPFRVPACDPPRV